MDQSASRGQFNLFLWSQDHACMKSSATSLLTAVTSAFWGYLYQIETCVETLDQSLDTREPEAKPFSNSLKRNQNTFLCGFYWTKDREQSRYRLKDANTWISNLDAWSLTNALSLVRNYYQVSLEWASSLLRRNAASRLTHSFHCRFLLFVGPGLEVHHINSSAWWKANDWNEKYNTWDVYTSWN